MDVTHPPLNRDPMHGPRLTPMCIYNHNERFYVHVCIGVNPWDWEIAIPRFWDGASWGRVARRRGRVVKYYYN